MLCHNESLSTLYEGFFGIGLAINVTGLLLYYVTTRIALYPRTYLVEKSLIDKLQFSVS